MASPKSSTTPPQPRDLEILGSNQIPKNRTNLHKYIILALNSLEKTQKQKEMRIIILFFAFIESYYMKKSCLQLKSEAKRRQQCTEAIKGNDTMLY